VEADPLNDRTRNPAVLLTDRFNNDTETDRNMKTIDAGSVYRLPVAEIREFGALLDTGDGNILLPSKEVPAGLEAGQELEVFIYRDSEDRLIATLRRPLAMPGEFACLQVKDVNQVGAFLDWGLEKDLFLPFKAQLNPLQAGESVVVKVLLDEISGRLIATSKLRSHLDRDVRSLNAGRKMEALLYEKTERGWRCILDNQWQGMIFHDDFFTEARIGDKMEVFIRKTRSDGLVDCSLRKAGFGNLKEKAPDILQMLKDAGGRLPYHDKSDPDEIARTFKMSKKSFKKLIGTLKKKGKLEIEKDGIRLL